MSNTHAESNTSQGHVFTRETTQDGTETFYAPALNLSGSFNEEGRVDLYCHSEGSQSLDELQLVLEELIGWVKDRRVDAADSTPTN